MTDQQFHYFVTLACTFLVLETSLRGFISVRRWMERCAQRKADAAYAAIREAEEPQWEPEFFCHVDNLD